MNKEKSYSGFPLKTVKFTPNSVFYTGISPTVHFFGCGIDSSFPGIISLILENVTKKLVDVAPVFRENNLAYLVHDVDIEDKTITQVDYKKLEEITNDKIGNRFVPFQLYAHYISKSAVPNSSKVIQREKFDYVSGSTNLLLAYMTVRKRPKGICDFTIMLNSFFDKEVFDELDLLVGKNSDGETVGKKVVIRENAPSFLRNSIFDICIKDANRFHKQGTFGFEKTIDKDISRMLNNVLCELPKTPIETKPDYQTFCEYFSKKLSAAASDKERNFLISLAKNSYRIQIEYNDILDTYEFSRLPYGPVE
jgi:hypothetical protein